MPTTDVPEGVVLDAAPDGVVLDAPPAADPLAEDEARLRTIFDAALRQSPDQAAGVLEVVKRTGVPQRIVEAQFPLFKAKAEQAGLDARRFRQENPGLADLILQRPHVAPVVQDELAKLGRLEWFLKAPGAVMARAGAAEEYTHRAFADMTGIAGDENRAWLQRYEQQGEQDLGARSLPGRLYVKFLELLPVVAKYGAAAGLGGSAAAAAAAPAAVAAGAPSGGAGAVAVEAGAGVFGATAATLALGYYDAVGPLYRRLLNEGVDPETAQNLAISGGVVNGGLFAGLGKWAFGFGWVKGAFQRKAMDAVDRALVQKTVTRAGAEFVQRYGTHVASGATLMAAQNVVNRAVTELGRDSTGLGGSVENVVADIPRDFVEGVEAMAIMAAIGPGRELLADVGRARASSEGALFLRAATEQVQDTKLLDRSPEEGRAFLEGLGKGTIIYSPVEDWNRFWTERGVDPREVAARVVSDGGRTYDEAVATKGDVEIPAAAYLEKLARSKHGTELLQEVRLAPDHRTPRQEAAETERLVAKAKNLADKPEEGKESDPVAGVKKDFAEKARAAGKSEAEADRVATKVADVFKNWGEQLGADALGLYRAKMEAIWNDALGDGARSLEAEQPKVELTPEEAAKVTDLQAQSRAAAEAEVKRLISRESKKADPVYMQAQRDRIAAEVNAELDQDPAQRALHFFRTGELRGPPGAGDVLEMGKKPLKLDREAVKGEFGAWIVDQLPADAFAKSKEDAVRPEDAAPLFGFGSAEELLGALRTAKPREEVVGPEVDRRIAVLFPGIADRPTMLLEAARDAAQGTAFFREGIVRLNALAREAGQKTPALSERKLTALAEAMLEGKTYTELRADRFDAQARTSAGRLAELKDPAKRLDEYEAYLLNRAAARLARERRVEMEKTARKLDRYTSDASRAEIGKAFEVQELPDGTKQIRQPYLEARDTLLAAFEFSKSASLKDVRGRAEAKAALEKWVAERWADGDSVIVDPAVLEALTRQTHWKDLTPRELEKLEAAADSITQQADLRAKFRIGEERVDTSRLIDQLTEHTLSHRTPIDVSLAGDHMRKLAERAAVGGRKALFAIRRPEQLVRALDRYDERGLWTKVYWNTLSDASYRFYDLVRTAGGEVQQMFRGMPAEERKRIRETTFKIEGEAYTLENAYVVALNAGNESNLSKMVRGMSDSRRLRLFGIGRKAWSGQRTVDEFLSHLTAADVERVNAIHRALDKFRPEIEALEKEDSGIAPPMLQAKPYRFKNADGKELVIEGGYYPMIYSGTFRAGKMQGEADTAAANGLPGLFQVGYERAMTPQGHLQSRVETYARPIDLTLDAMPRKLTMHAKDVAFRLPAKQLYRLLIDERIVGALTQTIGKEGYDVLVSHLKDSVNDVMLPDAGAGIFLRGISWARKRVTEALFIGNVGQTLQNLADRVTTSLRVPESYVMSASLRFAKDLAVEKEKVLALSPEMRLRAEGYHDSLSHAFESAFRKSGIAMKWEHAKEIGMLPFETTNAMIEYPVWLGAFEHARDQGNAEAEAVRHADGAVRDLFGGKRTVDLPPVMRDKVFRHFTMFAGWANAQLNLFLSGAGEARAEWSEGRRAKAVKGLMFIVSLQVAKQIASEVLVGRGPSDDDKDGLDAGDVGRWIAYKGVTMYPMQAPVVGSAIRAGEGEQSRDVSMTPWLNLLNGLVRATKATARAVSKEDELGDEEAVKLFLAWVQAGGQVAGAPNQATTSARYLMSRTGMESGLEDALGVAYGKKREGSLAGAILGE